MTVNGIRSRAKAFATSAAVASFSGENTTKAARATWNTPSPNWPIRRVANSRRKSPDRSNSRRSLTLAA
jgi:hypothetical protein